MGTHGLESWDEFPDGAVGADDWGKPPMKVPRPTGRAKAPLAAGADLESVRQNLASSPNPWRTLPQAMRDDLAGPLANPQRLETSRNHFAAWVKKYYGVTVGSLGELRLAQGGPPKPLVVQAAEWRFNEGFKDEAGAVAPVAANTYLSDARNSVVLVYCMMKWSSSSDLWPSVKTVTYVGAHGEIDFVPAPSEAALKSLLSAGGEFVPDYMARTGTSLWGLRGSTAGAALHFRGSAEGNSPCNAHIDIHNPGAHDGIVGAVRAVAHCLLDLGLRKHTGTVAKLWPAVEKTLGPGRLPKAF